MGGSEEKYWDAARLFKEAAQAFERQGQSKMFSIRVVGIMRAYILVLLYGFLSLNRRQEHIVLSSLLFPRCQKEHAQKLTTMGVK